MRRLRDEKLLVGVELAPGQLAVALRGEFLVLAIVGEAVNEDVFQVAEDPGVSVAGGEAGGDRAGGLKAKH